LHVKTAESPLSTQYSIWQSYGTVKDLADAFGQLRKLEKQGMPYRQAALFTAPRIAVMVTSAASNPTVVTWLDRLPG
jgi:hypothetical protein